jgi:acetyltransferase-like isoleucine patch superfamily enzyme
MITDRDQILGMIEADDIHLGKNVTFGGPDVHISAIREPARRVVIGDNVFIGKNFYAATPELTIGDYTNVHQSCRFSGYSTLSIGHNCWIDQNNILNSTERLEIGNGVCISAYSQFWTHFRWGDTVIGCRFDQDKPMSVGDDAYFGGMCFVSPVNIGEKAYVLGNSVVTKDLLPNRVYAGNPAKDITDKLGPPFPAVPVADRMKDMQERIGRFFESTDKWSRETIEIIDNWDFTLRPDVTYFNVSDRTYSKRGADIETDIMLFLLPTAKFCPKKV